MRPAAGGAGAGGFVADIVFHRYGDRTFLTQIWVSGTKSGHQVNKCKLEFGKVHSELTLNER